MIIYTANEQPNDNTEKFFKLIGWKQRMSVSLSGWWQQPDGECYPEEFLKGVALPSIETDCNEFFKYVIPEMFKKALDLHLRIIRLVLILPKVINSAFGEKIHNALKLAISNMVMNF